MSLPRLPSYLTSRITVITATIALLLGGLAPAASAGNACNGDICGAPVSYLGNNYWDVRTYANTYTFYGHFQLCAADGTGHCWNSIESTWHAGGSGNYFNKVLNYHCTWSAIAWQRTGSNSWQDIGDLGFYSC